MINHATTGHQMVGQIAGEVRAELARRRLTAADLAGVLDMSPHTAGRRISGGVPFNVLELALIADWLDIDMRRLLGTSQRAAS